MILFISWQKSHPVLGPEWGIIQLAGILPFHSIHLFFQERYRKNGLEKSSRIFCKAWAATLIEQRKIRENDKNWLEVKIHTKATTMWFGEMNSTLDTHRTSVDDLDGIAELFDFRLPSISNPWKTNAPDFCPSSIHDEFALNSLLRNILVILWEKLWQSKKFVVPTYVHFCSISFSALFACCFLFSTTWSNFGFR